MFRACIRHWWIASIIRRWFYGLIPVHCPADDAGNPPYVNAGISSGGLAAKATKLSLGGFAKQSTTPPQAGRRCL